MAEKFAAYDLRIRSIDRQPGEPVYYCPRCHAPVAEWSVWLHTPEWGPGDAGETRVLCARCALDVVAHEMPIQDCEGTQARPQTNLRNELAKAAHERACGCDSLTPVEDSTYWRDVADGVLAVVRPHVNQVADDLEALAIEAHRRADAIAEEYGPKSPSVLIQEAISTTDILAARRIRAALCEEASK